MLVNSTFLSMPYTIQIGLLFVLLVTGTWRKSFTATLFVVTMVVFFFNYASCPMEKYYYLINLASGISILRAMFHADNDHLIRR